MNVSLHQHRRSIAIYLAVFLLASGLGGAFIVKATLTPSTIGTTDAYVYADFTNAKLYLPSGLDFASGTISATKLSMDSNNITVVPASGTGNLTMSAYSPSLDTATISGNGTNIAVSFDWANSSLIRPLSVSGTLTNFAVSGYSQAQSWYTYTPGGTLTALFQIPDSYPLGGIPSSVTIDGATYNGPAPGYWTYVVGSHLVNVTVLSTSTSPVTLSFVPPSSGGGGGGGGGSTTTTTTTAGGNGTKPADIIAMVATFYGGLNATQQLIFKGAAILLVAFLFLALISKEEKHRKRAKSSAPKIKRIPPKLYGGKKK